MEIALHLTSAGSFSVKVYNSAGELVRVLREEIATTAPLDIVMEWDGLNQKGQQVASGVYVLHVLNRTQSLSAKLLIVR